MAVNKVDVNVIGLKAFKRIFTGPDNIVAGKSVAVGHELWDIIIKRNPGLVHPVIDFGAQKDLMAAAAGFESPTALPGQKTQVYPDQLTLLTPLSLHKRD